MPGRAPKLDVDELSAISMPELHGAAALVQPPAPPLHQRREHGEQVGSLLGESVPLARALPRLAVVLPLQQPVLDELAQPRRRDRLADLSALGEVVESTRSIERLPQDQE